MTFRSRESSDARLTIAVVGCDPTAPGGISRVIRITLDSPLARRWRLVPIATWVPGSNGQRAIAFLRALAQVWTLAACGHVQAVHLHMAARGSFWRKWMLSRPLQLLRVRVIVHIHDGTLPQWLLTRSRFTRDRVQHLLKRSDAVVTLSPFWMDTLKPLAPSTPWVVVRNPVAIPVAIPVATPAISGRPLGDGQPASTAFGDRRELGGKVILFLGRLREEKGLDDLLSAALAMQHHRPADVWHLAGDGDLPAVQRRVDALGLTAVVRLPGWLDEGQKARTLAAADVLVLPSHAEGQPLAVLEAMAWGIPVVASDVGDIPDLLASGAGLVVPKGDVQALVGSIRWVLDNPEQAHQMGCKGRNHVLEHHSIERMCGELDGLYRRLGLTALNESGPRPLHGER